MAITERDACVLIVTCTVARTRAGVDGHVGPGVDVSGVRGFSFTARQSGRRHPDHRQRNAPYPTQLKALTLCITPAAESTAVRELMVPLIVLRFFTSSVRTNSCQGGKYAV